MQLRRPALTVLALFVGLPALGLADADAAFIRRSVIKVRNDVASTPSYRVSTTVSGDAGAVASVRAELASDGGDEELPLVETDAWLHGAATIAALPSVDATVTLTLYDSANVSLGSASGTFDANGRRATGFVGTIQSPVWENDVFDRAATGDAPVTDVAVLSVEAFVAEKGYDLAFDLAGADTYAVAYATVTVTEPGAPTCLATDEKGNCLKWDTSKDVSTRTEVFWDDIGSVWEADTTVAHTGLVDVSVVAYDTRGRKVETATSKVGASWQDGGEGVSALATDEDPLTRVAIARARSLEPGGIEHVASLSRRDVVVVSEGWTAGDEVPVDAEIALDNGETITIPVNSYQRRGIIKYDVRVWSDASGHFDSFRVSGPSFVLPLSKDNLYFGREAVPTCTNGFCATVLVNEEGGYELAMTAYGDDTSTLPDEVELSLSVVDENGEEVAVEATRVTFDDDVTAVFASELGFARDPSGLGLSGRVTLLGEPNPGGRQQPLAKGTFYGAFSRDADGDLELAGADKQEVVSRGDIVVPGEAVFLTDREGTPLPPPAIQYGNGSGTKNATTTTSARPELL